ncbi:hypothetical protein G9C85_17460 [Halorubellus sp. JP-L1]|uniref:hypothetical protein n=1 Tax=Halorubellus sp. JP-L1 TaxID=2715753 RepID=UPI0014072ACE|nr:hypothetical protein [Halorubellus sp. JP-L1]NHN43408.1 hypothetical protein [Halorubellus sp. JP-L1]
MDTMLVRAGALLAVVGGTLAVYDSIVAAIGEPGVSMASGLLMLAASAMMTIGWVREAGSTEPAGSTNE